MIRERGGEINSDVPAIHYCDKGIVLGRRDAVEGAEKACVTFA